MFARRPKICHIPDYVSGKVNESILNYAYQARKCGVATISGFISVDSIVNIKDENSYVWFDLSNTSLPVTDAEFLCKINSNKIVKNYKNSESLNVINLQNVPALIDTVCDSLGWKESIEIIYDLNRIARSDDNGFFNRLYGGGYKPVYFLVFE